MRVIVDRPLTPSLLLEQKGWKAPPTPGFWKNRTPHKRTYSMLAHHGYIGEERFAGLLELRRGKTNRGSGTFTLEVQQRRLSIGNKEQVIEATITCKEDALSTPESWEMNSRFYDGSSRTIKNLSQYRTGRLEDRTLIVSLNGKEETRLVGPQFTADWSLLEAVGRMTAKAAKPVQFDYYQELNLLKPGHSIRPGKRVKDPFGNLAELHCVLHSGNGILPFQYWVSGDGLLVCVINSFDAWLLDSEASDRYHQSLKDLAKK